MKRETEESGKRVEKDGDATPPPHTYWGSAGNKRRRAGSEARR